MRPEEEFPLRLQVPGTRPPFFGDVPVEVIVVEQENPEEDPPSNPKNFEDPPSNPKNFEISKREVSKQLQNENKTRCSHTHTGIRQSGGDARPDWQNDGLLASVDPKDIQEIKRLRAMVDTRLHEALDAEDFEEAIRKVLAAGTPLAALDYAGRTALHLCVHRRALEPFLVLLSYEGSANLGDADGCPVLNVAILHKWVEGARAALAAGADVTAVTTVSKPRPVSCCGRLLPDMMRKISKVMQNGALIRYPCVDRSFLKLFYKQTPIHLAVELDVLGLLEELLNECRPAVDCPNIYGETALYTAVITKNLPAVKILLKRGASVEKTNKLLHVAARHPYILKYILDNTDITDSFDGDGYVALHKAVIINCPESVNFLLKRFNYQKRKVKSNGMTALHLAAFHGSIQAAQVILEYDANTVHELDDHGNTPLAVAADRGNKALILMLLKKGAVLATKSNRKKTIIELLASRLLDCSSYFELVFDEFIYTDEFNYINVDYGFLTETEGESQINVIEEFIRCGQSKILLHPLIESLLYLKWRHLLPVFWLIIGVYSVFMISFNMFVVQKFYYKDYKRNFTNSLNNTESRAQGLFEIGDQWRWLWIAIIYVSLSSMLGLELFCIYLKRLRYFGHLESWVKVCVLALGAVLPNAVIVDEPADWLRHAACAALLLGWLQAMFLLARFPYWGNYVLMFGKVAINLLKVLVTAVFLIIAFSFCFLIQFRSQSPFDGPFPALVKTLVMMSSEFDYEDLFGTKHDNELQETRTVVRLLFVLFVIFLAMVLMNFMVGAAVSDIKDLNVTGNIKRLEKQVQLLSILDSLVHGGLIDKIFKKTFKEGRYHKKVRIMCGIQVQWFVECLTTRLMLLYDSEALFQFYSNTYLLPLHKAFVDIATKKKEERECKCSCNVGGVADGGRQVVVNRNDSSCSDQIKIDPNLLQPQPNKQTNRTYLHDSSSKIEQLSLDMASIKQMTSDLTASMKELSSEITKLKI